MIAIGLRTLRTRAGAFLGALAMLAIVATVVASAGQLMASALRDPGPGRFARADLVVRAPSQVTLGHGEAQEVITVARSDRLPREAVATLGRVPGVERAVGDLSVPLSVVGRAPGGPPAHAHGWASAALTPYRLAGGRAPRAADEVVLDAGLARGRRLGSELRVVAPVGPRTLRLVGVVRADAEQERLQSAVFVTDGAAQGLSGLGPGYDAIVLLGADRDQIERHVPPGYEVLPRSRASVADVGSPRALAQEELFAVIGAGGGMTLLVAIFVVAGTITFVTDRRRREIALLRALGAGPGQVRRMLLVETAVVGLLAGAVGCAGARLLAGTFAGALTDVGVAPEGFAVQLHWVPDIVSLAAGTVVALLASLVAVRRGLKVRPGEALVAAAVPRRRLGAVRAAFGLLALGGGVMIVIALSHDAAAYAVLAALCFALGVATLAPLVLGYPAAWLGRLVARRGAARFLAGAGLATGRFRVGAVAGPIALVVALAGSQVVALATAGEAVRDVSAQRVQADRVLVAGDGGGLPPGVAEEAGGAGLVATEVFLPAHGTSALPAAGLDPGTLAGTLDLDVRAGRLGDVHDDAVAISARLAEEGDVRIGQPLSARLADASPRRLRVVAIYGRALGLGDVVLSRPLALAHATAPLDAAVFVQGDAGRMPPGVRSLSRDEYFAALDSELEDGAQVQWVVAALMLLMAAIAVFNSGAMAAAERRSELLLARLAGATRVQVTRAQVIEALATTLVGIAGGVAVVAASLAGIGNDAQAGSLVVPFGQTAFVLALGAALGLLGTLLPGALIGRAGLTATAGLRE
ncbi:putative ABC transport system permease protein [Solirubrobacter pauli]|uniref:Putative ABC transport system permease protein n=1 Tax=Solirubrobacter pauli TaxID=166793 RepID=A0A660LI39_9ACTN|nr:ABC transporter permease [Solirubrobacter pauli]RKQ92734.1 putative ABC transport system permease protein [Solirubrobacter pauli]